MTTAGVWIVRDSLFMGRGLSMWKRSLVAAAGEGIGGRQFSIGATARFGNGLGAAG